MESNLKQFFCQLHPSQTIQGLRKIPNSSKQSNLVCFECLISENVKNPQEEIDLLQNFASTISKFYNKIKQDDYNLGGLPDSSSQFLKNQEEIVKSLKNHIKGQVSDINNGFESFKKEVIRIIDAKQKALTSKLIHQETILESNFTQFKKSLEQYYGNNSDKEYLSTSEKVVSAMNKCNSANDLEKFLDNIKKEINEHEQFSSVENRGEIVRQLFKEFQDSLQNQTELLPKTVFSSQVFGCASLVKKFEGCLSEFWKETLKIENEIKPESLIREQSASLYDSKIMNFNNKLTLNNLIQQQLGKSFSLELLYRGSRDGFEASQFHKLCDGVKHTISIFETKGEKKKFGGYCDKDWGSIDGGFVRSINSWIFSLDLEKAYDLKSGETNNAIGCIQKYGPTFGYDIQIVDQGDIKRCHTKLGCTYGPYMDSAYELSQLSFFYLNEIEVYKLNIDDDDDNELERAK